ncbi:MAG: aminotransferase class I/II-fold pyridoxal phosphate-dependent enzyme [Candidatus Omnitrophota bacterium]|nr:aminotransferase class I/II-fold pyridoxal phosphate-dependent enzyme [Candidatus Omnitrophota bacterium]
MSKVLVTGGAGYLGSVLCRRLLDNGYSVRCFDRLYFGVEPVRPLLKNKKFELISGNILNIDDFPDIFKNVDSVIHLAGIANDPTAELDPQLTHKVNYESSVRLAGKAKEHNIKRFIFASSCSVYGKGLANIVNEESPLNPVSVYAESKMNSERDIIALTDKDFHPISLRQATLYGVSPRMRVDLAINLMVLHALSKGKIFIWGGGEQWRPFLHVEDAADAFVYCLGLPVSGVSGKIYNLGSTKDNLKIIELANIVKDTVTGTKLDIIPENPDKRSYRVSCDKIVKELKWRPKKKIGDGIKELMEFFAPRKEKSLNDPLFYNIRTVQNFVQSPAIVGGDPIRADFLPFSLPSLGKEEEAEVIDTLRSGWLTRGPKTARLEDMFKDYIGCKHAICVSSCTAALHLSLLALGIKKGDEVITSPITWPATANVIVHTGATPVFADVDRETLNIDPSQIEKKITSKTKAIIPVHMAGQPCEMDRIRRLASKYKLRIIEDAAHAIGASYKSKKIGTISDFACFSFYPIKNMTTIEGGLVVTDNPEWAEKIRVYSLHGVSNDAWKRYDSSFKSTFEVVYPGFKYNMSDVQASLGLHQLPKLDSFIKERRLMAQQYNEAFREVKEISVPNQLQNAGSAHHLYIIILDIDRLKISRDEFMNALKRENIGVGLHFKSLHVQRYYKNTFKLKDSNLPNALYLSERILSLPMYPKMTQYDVDTVIKAVKKLITYYKK